MKQNDIELGNLGKDDSTDESNSSPLLNNTKNVSKTPPQVAQDAPNYKAFLAQVVIREETEETKTIEFKTPLIVRPCLF